jgi:hypothetical protein
VDGSPRLQDDADLRDYAPAANEAELVNAAFARASINLSINLSETESNSNQEDPAKPD